VKDPPGDLDDNGRKLAEELIPVTESLKDFWDFPTSCRSPRTFIRVLFRGILEIVRGSSVFDEISF